MQAPTPPSWPLSLLRWVLRPEYIEEIEGDMEEWFYDQLETRTPATARRAYAWNVLLLLRLSLIRSGTLFSSLYRPIMLKNHFLVALRIFKRERIYTLVNLLSMSISLAIALLILLYVQYETSYESYNPNSDRMVRITMDYLNGGTVIDQDCETYPPLGPMITDQFPEVESFTRTYGVEGLVVEVDGQPFGQTDGVYATDSSFFNIFGYELVHGSTDGIFRAPFEAVITESTARRLFGRTDVVGKRLQSSEDEFSFLIKGVMKDSPLNTHLKVNFLFSYATMLAAFGEREDNWGGNNTLTYFLLKDMAQYDRFLENLDRLNEQLIAEDKLGNELVIAQPAKDIHLYSHKSFEAEINGDATSVYFLFGVAMLVIVIAIVNYINLATSKALDRAREVGVRKVLGSTLGQLRGQFFVEAFMINAAGGLLAVFIVNLSWSAFKRLADLPYELELIQEPWIWGALVVGIIASTLLSGILPAQILSSFKPVAVLKGKLGQDSKGVWLRKGLVVFQFTITLFLLVQTLTAGKQLSFMREIDLGVDIERTLVVRINGGDEVRNSLEAFRGVILNQADFQTMAYSSCVPGLPDDEMGTTTGINMVDALEESSFNFYIYLQDAAFIDAMKMTLLAGENFLPNGHHRPQDDEIGEVLVNEEAIRLWGIPNPETAIGKEIDMWGNKWRIRGVIKNFHQAGAKDNYIPMIHIHAPRSADFASIRLQPGRTAEQLDNVRNLYKETFPNSPFDYFFMDQEYDKLYRADERFSQVFSLLTGFAILIACIGLFGLVSFTVIKRSREIGIRKVLGAGVGSIIGLLGREFIGLVALASVVAIPLTYWLISQWLERYAFRIDLSPWLFVIPIIIMVLIATVTVLTQTYQIAVSNPVDSIRDE